MQEVQDPQNRLPPELMRRYDVVFVPRSLQKPLKLREIGSKNVGRLVTVQVSLETEQCKQYIHIHLDIDHAMWMRRSMRCCAAQDMELLVDVLHHLPGL